MANKKTTIDHGNNYPYDAPDSFLEGNGQAPPPRDWQHSAARGIVADLRDRRGIKNGFEDVDEETRVEIIQSIIDIIETARVSAQRSV